MATADALSKKIHTLQEKISPEVKEKVDEIRLQVFHHISHAHHGLDESAADYKAHKAKIDAECAAFEKKLWASQPKDVQATHASMVEIDKLEKDLQKLRGVIFA